MIALKIIALIVAVLSLAYMLYVLVRPEEF